LLDTTTVTNGAYTLESLAYDGAGKSAYSAGITVTVDNSPPRPPASWVVVPSPDVSPTSNDSLASVSCPTASFCAAVGSSSGSPLIETYQGSAWSITPAADTSPPSLAGLQGVSCSSPSFCMAVGDENEVPGGTPYNPTSEVPAAETWNGSSWQLLPVPDNGPFGGAYRGDVLTAVSCISPSFCAAVGVTTVRGPGEVASSTPSGYVEIWNGSTWSVTSTGGEVEDVSCSRADLCVAVGTQGGAQVNGIVTLPPYGGPSFVDSYDGTTWTLTTFPVPATNSLYSGATLTTVSCAGTWCLAAGTQDLFTQTSPESWTETSSVIDARYDGTSWSTTAVPAPPAQPNGLVCVAAGSCIGVGGGSNLEQLTSNTWSAPPSPQLSGAFNSVSCGTASACTAVGAESGTPTRTLIAVGPSSSEQPSISGAPPPGTVGLPYSFTFTTAGVPSPVVSSSGTLPPGLTLSASGLLAGTPVAAGSYLFTLNASNGVGSPAIDSVTLVVNKGATVTSIVSSADPAGVGQELTYTASVSVAAPGNGTPSGTVKFTDNGHPIDGCGAALVSSGEASCEVRYSALGSHSTIATYSGDANFTGSASPILGEQTVEGIALRITGPLNYTNAGPVTSGQITVQPHGSGPVTSVVGTAQLAGIDGGSVTVSFDIHTIFGFSFGTIMVQDPRAHVGLYAPVILGRIVRPLPNSAASSTTGLSVNHGAFGLSHLSWSVDD
jgi:Bacterial Ig-like domain (group 3)